MENKNLFNRRGLKSFRASFRNKSLSDKVAVEEMLNSKKTSWKNIQKTIQIWKLLC
jgi:hypothetical protein